MFGCRNKSSTPAETKEPWFSHVAIAIDDDPAVETSTTPHPRLEEFTLRLYLQKY